MPRQSGQLHKKQQFLLNQSHDFVTLINANYRYEIVNDAYCWAMEKSKREILGSSVEEVWGSERFREIIKPRLDTCFAGEEVHFEERFTFGPFERTMRVSMFPYAHSDGKVTHVAVFNTDVSRIAEIESKLSDYEYRDPVTGLFNRRSMDVILDMELEKAERSRGNGIRALLFVRLRNLGSAIQTYGHHVGDLLLENTGTRIRRVLRGTDYVFRFEGTDLAVLIDGIERNTDAAPIARKICNAVSTPYRHGNIDMVLTCNIGVAVYPDDAGSRDELIQSAISARVEAEKGGESFLMYNSELHRLAYARMERTTALNRAFESESFQIHYHPIVNTENIIVGAEALLRWSLPDGTVVPPAEFIPLAEEYGLIQAIDKWVLYNACRQVAAWNGHGHLYITVNVSAGSFTDPNLPELIGGALRSAGNLDPSRVKIEITESQCMDNPDAAIRQMAQLREMGIEVWIDDFGTGHSSLSYLRRLPASIMKIDREFVQDLADSPEDMVYLANIIQTIKAQKKEVVVEGVENAQQHDILARLGSPFMQGFHYSRPVPQDQFCGLLEAGGYVPMYARAEK